MAFRKDRPRPRAYLDQNQPAQARSPLKPVVLSTGRGDVKLTRAEARELGEELVRVAAGRLAAFDADRGGAPDALTQG